MHRIAIAYDFDGTLIKNNMQDKYIMDVLGFDNYDEFWRYADKKAIDYNTDQVFSYMLGMIEHAEKANINITKSALKAVGKNLDFYPGVINWFNHINQYCKNLGIEIEHYIISSGLYEIIDGCPIRDYFKYVFSSRFHYDENECAVFPRITVNYTNKTQFLFRINRGMLDYHSDINNFMPDHKRRIQFNDIIYIGDGMTDIPTMKMLTYKGGHPIAVYDDISPNLVIQGATKYDCRADYCDTSELSKSVKRIIDFLHNSR